MRKRLTRFSLFIIVVIALAYLFQFYFTHIEGDGKNTPEEALPTDQQYVWIEGPKTEKEHRYFFLSNGIYFGTGTVTKNLTGWSSEDGVYSKLPNTLVENKISRVYSDSRILYGLIKPIGDIKVTVNGVETQILHLNHLAKDIVNLYNVEGYFIWFIDLSQIDNKEPYTIKVLNTNDQVLNELVI